MSGNQFSLWSVNPETRAEVFVQSSMNMERLQCKMDQFLSWYNPLGLEVVCMTLQIRCNTTGKTRYVAKFVPGKSIQWKPMDRI